MNWKIICSGIPENQRDFILELEWLMEWIEEQIKYKLIPEAIKYKEFKYFKINKYATYI